MAGNEHPRLICPCLDAEDGPGLARFWSDLLGLPFRPGQGPDDDPGFIVIDHHDGTPALAVQQVASLPRATWPSAEVPAQIHLDLMVDDRASQAQQMARAIALGASVLDDRREDDSDPLVVMADPAGHPFCLISPPA